jgi:hypothetical protein
MKKCNGIYQDFIKDGKRFYGFPINFTFTTYQNVWEMVESTGI